MARTMLKVMVYPEHADPFVVHCTARDVLMWERTTKGASMADLRHGIPMDAAYRIVWHALNRLGLNPGPQKDFEENVDIDTLKADDGEQEAVDPTRPGAFTEM